MEIDFRRVKPSYDNVRFTVLYTYVSQYTHTHVYCIVVKTISNTPCNNSPIYTYNTQRVWARERKEMRFERTNTAVSQLIEFVPYRNEREHTHIELLSGRRAYIRVRRHDF